MLKTTPPLRAVTLSPGGSLPLSSTLAVSFSSMITAEVQQGCQTCTEEGVSWAHTPGLPTSALLEMPLVVEEITKDPSWLTLVLSRLSIALSSVDTAPWPQVLVTGIHQRASQRQGSIYVLMPTRAPGERVLCT